MCTAVAFVSYLFHNQKCLSKTFGRHVWDTKEMRSYIDSLTNRYCDTKNLERLFKTKNVQSSPVEFFFFFHDKSTADWILQMFLNV